MKENLRKLLSVSLTAVVMTSQVFWDVLPCRTVNIYSNSSSLDTTSHRQELHEKSWQRKMEFKKIEKSSKYLQLNVKNQ